MQIEIYEGSQILPGALKALKHRLFQTGWELGGRYREVRAGYDTGMKTILIAEVDGKPVASAAVFKWGGGTPLIQMFVRGAYRRKGIGSAMFEKAMKHYHRDRPFNMWVDHSRKATKFYEKNCGKDWTNYSVEEDKDIHVPVEAFLKTVHVN